MTTNNIEDRLNEFAETHGAVLLGMHKELSTLKADSQAALAATIQDVRDQIDAFSKSQKDALHTTEKRAKAAQHSAEEAKRLLDETRTNAEKLHGSLKAVIQQQQERIEGHSSTIARTQQLLQNMLLDHKKAVELHNLRVSRFNMVTRRIAIAGAALAASVLVWYGGIRWHLW
jgi:chromosome segregation ATPase